LRLKAGFHDFLESVGKFGEFSARRPISIGIDAEQDGRGDAFPLGVDEVVYELARQRHHRV
jgi:hypothetical protein